MGTSAETADTKPTLRNGTGMDFYGNSCVNGDCLYIGGERARSSLRRVMIVIAFLFFHNLPYSSREYLSRRQMILYRYYSCRRTVSVLSSISSSTFPFHIRCPCLDQVSLLLS